MSAGLEALAGRGGTLPAKASSPTCLIVLTVHDSMNYTSTTRSPDSELRFDP
jgi:hypothetical protein